MRMFLALILLLVPVNVIAVTCTDDNCGAGCYMNVAGCAECPMDHYCPQGSTQPTPCPGPHSNSTPFNSTGGTTGAATIDACNSIKITDCIGDNDVGGSHQTVHLNTPIYVTCYANHWVESTQTSLGYPYCSPDGFYAVQRNPDEYCSGGKRTGKMIESLDIGSAIINYPDFTDNYHFEVKPIFNKYDSGYWQSNPYNFELVCVQNTLSCKKFRNKTEPKPAQCDLSMNYESAPAECRAYLDSVYQAVSAPIDNMEILSNCMPNVIPGTNCSDDAAVSGEATWQTNDFDYWDVSNCKCETNNGPINDANCYGSLSTDAATSSSESINTVHTIYENVIYQTPTSNENFDCNHCFPDTENTVYYVSNSDYIGGKVRQCTAVTQLAGHRGYYRQAFESFCGPNTSHTASFDTNPCQRTKCPKPGQTTDTKLPLSTDDCKFGDNTYILDGGGNIKLKHILTSIINDGNYHYDHWRYFNNTTIPNNPPETQGDGSGN